MGDISETFKRAFANFFPVAKRDLAIPGAIEVDLGKVATEFAKAAAGLGPTGDVVALEKAISEIDSFLATVRHDPITDSIVAPANEVSKRFAVEAPEEAKKAADPMKFSPRPEDADGSAYHVDHGSGRAKKPATGSKEHRDLAYTAGSGVADEASPKGEYTQSTDVSIAKPPKGGKPGTTFDQEAGGPNGTKKTEKRAKAQQPANPEAVGSPGMLLTEDLVEPQESLVSEGFGMSGKKVAKSEEPEERWARDMAEDVATAKAGGGALDGDVEGDDDGDEDDAPKKAPKGEPDDRSAADAKRKAKKAAGKAKAQYDGPEETVDDLDDEDRDAHAAAASKPNTGGDPDETEDEIEGGKRKSAKAKKAQTGADASGAVDEEGPESEADEEPKGKRKAKKKWDADDEADDEDEDEDEEEPKGKKPFPPKKTAKSEDASLSAFDKEFAGGDMAPPAGGFLRKSERMTDGEIPVQGQQGAREARRKMQDIRKSALSPEQKRRQRIRELRDGGYNQGEGSNYLDRA